MRLPCLLGALVVLAPCVAATGLPGLSSDEPYDEPKELLVGYRHGAIREVTDLVDALGGKVLSKNEALRYLVVTVRSTSEFLVTAPLDPAVEYVEDNDVIRGAGAQWNGAQWNGAQWNGAQWNSNSTGDPGRGSQWGLQAVRAPDAWNVTTGERRASLCVLDSGVAWDHPDLEANVWRGPDGARGFNAIDPRESAYDDAGHGTHMAGIAAAVVGNGIGGAGVANVTIMPVKVLGADGRGKEDDLATGLVWCAEHGADVALMALSVDNEGPTVRNALQQAADAGVVLVASAGNGGACSSCVAYPARDSNVIAVSAVTPERTLAPFSAQGPQVDLAAPGTDVVSTFGRAEYASGSGTSQAAAFVAGAATLLRDVDQDATPKQVRNALRDGAQDLGPSGRDARYGAGLLDVAASLGGS